MTILNLGIIVDNLDPHDGGKFTYQVSLINNIGQYKFKNVKINFFTINQKKNGSLENIQIKVIKYKLFNKIIDFFFQKLFKILKINYFSFLDNFFLKNKIDLIYFITPNHLAMYIYNTCMINTVWDLFHHDGIEFPETGSYHAYNLRDQMLKKTLPRSIAIICDSYQTINKLSQKYLISKNRCYKFNYPTPSYLKNNNQLILKINNFDLKKTYIFYPSQLWPHKNHIYILEAIKIYNSNNNDKIYFLFSGSDKGNLDYIKKTAIELNIDKYIVYLGFVNHNELVSLYKNALALVMPTYALPTNIPPLEALYLECPIIYSKNEANNELPYKESLWEVDLNNPEDLSNTILKIKKNKNNIVNQKIRIGKTLLENLNNNRAEEEAFNKIFRNFLSKRKTYM